jgi:hypothetical protein
MRYKWQGLKTSEDPGQLRVETCYEGWGTYTASLSQRPSFHLCFVGYVNWEHHRINTI